MKLLQLCFLEESGLIFEINRKVLHPLGYSLIMNGQNTYELHQVDEPAGCLYSANSFMMWEEKINSFMDRIGKSKLSMRKTILGFEEQVSADQGTDSNI